MYPDDDLLPISALQHLLFCERQCALIHVERLWAENRFTVEGQHLHKKAHEGADEWRDGVRMVRGLALRSYELGLIGKADVVEFRAGDCPSFSKSATKNRTVPLVPLNSARPPLIASPVEYKRGRPKENDSDRVQLCAQALCLEEMLGVAVTEGALFYGKRRRRTVVPFDTRLRETTVAAARRLHELVSSAVTPPAIREPKCETCSLVELCLPAVLAPRRAAAAFADRQFDEHLACAAPASAAFDDAGSE